MQPTDKQSPIVEVNLQDVFYSNPARSHSAASRSRSAASRSHLGDLEDYQIPESVWAEWITKWLEILKPSLPDSVGYELTLRLSDDRELQNLNELYRNLDRPTDVLAFAALEVEVPNKGQIYSECEPLYLGDVIISVDTAQRQAKQQQHSLKKEIVWLAVHGFLHLLGWDHPDESSLARMIAQQETLLKIDSLKNTGL